MSATIYSGGRKCPHQPSHLTMGTIAKALHVLGSMARAWGDDTAKGDHAPLNQPSITVAALRWENSQRRVE